MKSRKSKINVYIHFVWSTQDRRPLITEEMERPLYRYISAVCVENGCPALAIGGMPDHLHLLVALSNSITLAQLMKRVKGASSHFISEELKDGGWFAWQQHYGAFSVSASQKAKVIHYVNSQKLHHEGGSTWQHAEQDYEYDD